MEPGPHEGACKGGRRHIPPSSHHTRIRRANGSVKPASRHAVTRERSDASARAQTARPPLPPPASNHCREPAPPDTDATGTRQDSGHVGHQGHRNHPRSKPHSAQGPPPARAQMRAGAAAPRYLFTLSPPGRSRRTGPDRGPAQCIPQTPRLGSAPWPLNPRRPLGAEGRPAGPTRSANVGPGS